MNEELQSANEELESSKEELQSLNEELNTVNNQLHDKIDELETTNNDMVNLLNCTDVATVFLDTEFRIRRFTPEATAIFTLIPADVGRPIANIAMNCDDPNLLADAAQVLSRLGPNETEVGSRDGRWWLRRIVPYRTLDNRIEGVVTTYFDVTRRKRDEQALRESRQQLAAELAAMTRLHELVARLLVSVDMIAAMTEVLDAAVEITAAEMGNVQLLDPAAGCLQIVAQRGFRQDFLDHFRAIAIDGDSACARAMKAGQRVIVEDVQTDPQYEPHRAVAASAGYRAVQSTPLVGRDGQLLGMLSTHYPRPGRPGERDLRVLDLYARQAADFIERQRAKEAIARLNVELEQRVAERTQDVRRLAAIVETSDDAIYGMTLDGTVTSWNRGAERLFGYTAAEAIGMPWLTLVAPEDRAELDHKQAQLLRGETVLPFEATRRHKDGRPIVVSKALSTIRDATGAVVGFAAIARDISDRKRLEREIVEIALLEQQRLGADLHDALGQELTALGLLAGGLVESLARHSPADVETASRIGDGLRQLLEYVRDISHGLRASVEGGQLHGALQKLVSRLSATSRIRFDFDGGPVQIEDSMVATYLYHIAQEACTNALRHSQAEHVSVKLAARAGRVTLSIRDDGIGMSPETTAGLGVRIMHSRARAIGADLTIKRGDPGGTIVTCTLPAPGRREAR